MQTALHGGNNKEGFYLFLWQFVFFEDVRSERIFGSLIAKSGRKNKKIN
jgi:hypothetical protein